MIHHAGTQGRNFVNGFVTGENLEVGSPILLLRNKLAARSRGQERPKRDQFVWLISCASAYLNGETLIKMPGSAGDRYSTWCRRLKLPINTSVSSLVSQG